MADTHVFFIVDGDRLERQSWLLATSLAVAHEAEPHVKLYAYSGAAWLPNVCDTTHAVFEACGVALRELPAPPAWAKPYPHGNKIVAAAAPRGAGRSVFVDTDMVCLKSLRHLSQLPDTSVAMAPEGKATWGPMERWERAYAHFDMAVPTWRVQLLRGNHETYVPYFNAGFVSFPEPSEVGAPSFGTHWLETALDFDHNCAIANKRPWLDQITLPLTLARFGYGAEVLPETYNYSLSNRADYAATPDAYMLHYHRNRFLEQAPQWPALLQACMARVPKAHRAGVRDGLVEAGLTL